MERKERGRNYSTIETHSLALTTTPRSVPCPWQLSREPNCTVNINSTKLWDPWSNACVSVCSQHSYSDATRIKSVCCSISHPCSSSYVKLCFCWNKICCCCGTVGWKCVARTTLHLSRKDRIKRINSEILVTVTCLKLPKVKRKLSLLSSIKKHFKCLNDTSFHYSLQPATSSTELSAWPQSASQHWLSDCLVVSSETQTHMHTKTIYTHTHEHYAKHQGAHTHTQ